MVSKDSLLKIKQDVESYVGQEILVKANIGRNKYKSRIGVIDSTYPNLFVFKELETENKLSYSYADLITNNLELSLPTGESITNYDFSTPKYARL
jgi:uncharacterized protein Veg